MASGKQDAATTIGESMRAKTAFIAEWRDEVIAERAAERDQSRAAALEQRLQVLRGITEQLESAHERLPK